MVDHLELADWRRWMHELYARVRREPDPYAGWELWCQGVDLLHARHPQSPVPAGARAGFAGVARFDHDPWWRTLGRVERRPPERTALPASDGAETPALRIGRVHVELEGDAHALDLYWLEGHGGGLFLPFRDDTNGVETDACGRYLIDAAAGADLGDEDGLLVLDFNFAHHPPCAHDPTRSCPLPPDDARLALRVTAGERFARVPTTSEGR